MIWKAKLTHQRHHVHKLVGVECFPFFTDHVCTHYHQRTHHECVLRCDGYIHGRTELGRMLQADQHSLHSFAHPSSLLPQHTFCFINGCHFDFLPRVD